MFSVDTNVIKNNTRELENCATNLGGEVRNIAEVYSMLDGSLSSVRPSLDKCLQNTVHLSRKVYALKDILSKIALLYEQTENDIISNTSTDDKFGSSIMTKAQAGAGVVMAATASAAINSSNVPVTNPAEALLGNRTGIENGQFVKILDENGNPLVNPDGSLVYGGDQGWFANDPNLDLSGYGCGVIAAVNLIYYLTGTTEVTKDEYMKLVYSFFDSGFAREYAINKGFPIAGQGATPGQLENFIKDECKKRGVDIDPKWQYFSPSMESRYDYIKDAVGNNKPVMWSLYDNDGESCPMYKISSDGKLQQSTTVNSHYVTATGVYESYDANGKLQRYVEVSSWGDKYYVNWDEYIKYMDVDIAKDQSTPRKVLEIIEDGLANEIGSSIMQY